MPFTPAHAAAVLPLWRTGLPLAAMVCGAMAPDLPVYCPAVPWLGSAYRLTHSVHGTLLADMPLAVGLLAAWTVLSPPLLALMPRALRQRVGTARPRWSWLVPLAGWLGALTHVCWDYWTHDYGFFVRHLSPLRRGIGHGLQVYNVLQQLSTVVGLAVVAAAVLRWYRAARPDVATPGLSRRLRMAVLTLIATATVATTVVRARVPLRWHFSGLRLARAIATQAAEGLVIGALGGVVAYAIIWWALPRVRTG